MFNFKKKNIEKNKVDTISPNKGPHGNTMNTVSPTVDSDMGNMTTLSGCMTSLIKKGYMENFVIKHDKLFAPSIDKHYGAAETTIDNFYRFEGPSDPSDSAVLYAIQTADGLKGVLLDAYGTYGDEELNKFVREVEEIYKSMHTKSK